MLGWCNNDVSKVTNSLKLNVDSIEMLFVIQPILDEIFGFKTMENLSNFSHHDYSVLVCNYYRLESIEFIELLDNVRSYPKR